MGFSDDLQLQYQEVAAPLQPPTSASPGEPAENFLLLQYQEIAEPLLPPSSTTPGEAPENYLQLQYQELAAPPYFTTPAAVPTGWFVQLPEMVRAAPPVYLLPTVSQTLESLVPPPPPSPPLPAAATFAPVSINAGGVPSPAAHPPIVFPFPRHVAEQPEIAASGARFARVRAERPRRRSPIEFPRPVPSGKAIAPPPPPSPPTAPRRGLGCLACGESLAPLSRFMCPTHLNAAVDFRTAFKFGLIGYKLVKGKVGLGGYATAAATATAYALVRKRRR